MRLKFISIVIPEKNGASIRFSYLSFIRAVHTISHFQLQMKIFRTINSGRVSLKRDVTRMIWQSTHHSRRFRAGELQGMQDMRESEYPLILVSYLPEKYLQPVPWMEVNACTKNAHLFPGENSLNLNETRFFKKQDQFKQGQWFWWQG